MSRMIAFARIGILTLGILIPCFACGQQTFASKDPQYAVWVSRADSARQAANYEYCVECYEKGFAISQNSFLSLFRSATCYAQLGNFDAAYEKLLQTIDMNYEYICPQCEEEDLLEPIRKDKDWEKVMKKCAEAKAAYEASLNMPLKRELDSMVVLDQQYRGGPEMDSIQANYGWDSPQMRALWAKQTAIDSSNMLRLEEILATYGYPGESLVGRQSAGAAFLILQHADLPFQEKYLPLLSEAAEQGELAKYDLALLIDRVRMRQNKPQLYGSQIRRDPESGEFSIYEIEDEAHVNERRAEVGLPPLEDYVKRWGIDYVLPLKDKE